jgi:predicted PurR-regulated permease PerM
MFAGLTNFIPYVGQILGGGLPTLIALGHSGSIGDALIVAAVYLAVVGVEGYIVTPYIMGRSLDLNGTTVLIACLFWGFLWGLVGLVLAMPITVTLKLVFQNVPELNRWAELMSRDWQTPPAKTRAEELPPDPSPDGPGPPGVPQDALRPRTSAPAGRN